MNQVARKKMFTEAVELFGKTSLATAMVQNEHCIKTENDIYRTANAAENEMSRKEEEFKAWCERAHAWTRNLYLECNKGGIQCGG